MSTATSVPPGRGSRAPLLEVIFHELESEWALEIVRGVERVAGRHQLAVILSEMQGRRTPGRGWIEGVLTRRPIGVIAVFSDLSDSMRAQLRSRDIPLVVVDPTGEPLHDTPSIGATNWNGGLTATRHLLGPRAPADRASSVGRPASSAAGRGSTGSERRWTRPRVPIDASLLSHGKFDVDEGIETGRALLQRRDRPTAIVDRQRPAGARRLPGGARATAPHPRGRERRRLRRPAGRPVGRAAADDHPPAAHRDGRGRRRAGPRRWPVARSRRRRGSS